MRDRGCRSAGVPLTVIAALALALGPGCDGGGTRGAGDPGPDARDAGGEAAAGDPGDLAATDVRAGEGGEFPGDPGDAPGDVPAGEGLADAAEVPDLPDADSDCVPDCAGRECGPDGCGGYCGPGCPEALCMGTIVCNEVVGRCVETCSWEGSHPTSWGPVGAVSTLQAPSEADYVQAACFDFTGDGTGDSGIRGLAGQVNPALADAIANGTLALLFELKCLADFKDSTAWLNVLMGRSVSDPPATSGDFYVDDASYLQDVCMPWIYFQDATITGGMLAAGPAQFQASIPIEDDATLDLTLIHAQVKGRITEGSAADGFALEDGILSGVVTKEQLSAAVAKLQAICDAAPQGQKPDFCTYLEVSYSQMAFGLFDLHQNRDADGIPDGTFSAKSKDLPGDAVSVCVRFTLSKARVVGYPPAD